MKKERKKDLYCEERKKERKKERNVITVGKERKMNAFVEKESQKKEKRFIL